MVAALPALTALTALRVRPLGKRPLVQDPVAGRPWYKVHDDHNDDGSEGDEQEDYGDPRTTEPADWSVPCRLWCTCKCCSWNGACIGLPWLPSPASHLS